MSVNLLRVFDFALLVYETFLGFYCAGGCNLVCSW